jgi:sugar lactone lactonase YvrE
MIFFRAFTVLFSLHCSTKLVVSSATNLKHLAKWTRINFAWDNLHTEADYLNKKEYIVENNEIAGIKVWKCKMFVTVPRWKPGVPSTLNYINLPEGDDIVSDPTLIPYPSWAQNEHKNCSSFQWVQSMEIDSNGLMWVIDKGSLEGGGTCPPKIVLLDLKDNGAVIKSIVVPNNIAGKSSFMNDIALDSEAQIAYITDASGDGGIIAYDNNYGKFYRFEDPTLYYEPASKMIIDGIAYNFTTPVDGIALSPDRSRVFYCPLRGFHLYSISTKELLSISGRRTTPTTIIDHGSKKTAADGMVFDCDGNLYYAGLTSSSVWTWAPDFKAIHHSDVQNNEMTITGQDRVRLGWIDTFGITGKTLYLTANNLHRFFFGHPNLDYSKTNTVGNIHIWSIDLASTSYMNCPASNVDDSCDRKEKDATRKDNKRLSNLEIAIVALGCILLFIGVVYIGSRCLSPSKRDDEEPLRKSLLNPAFNTMEVVKNVK